VSGPDLSHYIPRRLDDKGKFLFWEYDVMFVALAGICLGIATDYRVFGLVLGITLATVYNKTKSGQHPGMTAHLLYWFTGMPQPGHLPPSHFREFNG
jgi:conjugal transfer pilus assembly protein TraL